jgi:ubiquinone/menaquinone biosynthesis C-methylase UbiE
MSQIEIIRQAYDETVDRYFAGVEDEVLLPSEFRNSERYARFKECMRQGPCGSHDPRIPLYLAPQSGMNFLDIGSGVNLIARGLEKWSSTYYGIDISGKLVHVTRNHAERNGCAIGGLSVADAAHIPFRDGFFDIGAAIGVFEYYDLAYIGIALQELRRVLKPQGRAVIDMPNGNHPAVDTMIELEAYLGRSRDVIPTSEEMEHELRRWFSVERIDDSHIMTLYFLRA